MPRKGDADEILELMQQLPSSLGLDRNRHFWARWLFRSDHVENAAAILNSGRLLSRAAAERGELIRVDSGSPQYVDQLSERDRNLVRLYFRPRTPTQYRNEGIRPKHKIELNAHMPVPVYLLFAMRLLAEEGVRFTKGRLTGATAVGDTAEFLKSIDFADVYHDGSVGRLGESKRRAKILNARHSEVVVEEQVSLDTLTHIICRSAAERETLLNLITAEARDQWLGKIHVDAGHRRMFEKRGTFVQRADLSSHQSQFLFYSNIDPDMRGPFDMNIEWSFSGRTESVRQDTFVVSSRPVVYSLAPPWQRYQVRVMLDGNLAYLGDLDEHYESDLVF